MNEEYPQPEDVDPLAGLDSIDADSDEPTAETLAELAALAESGVLAELGATDLEVAAQLAEARRALEDQRALTTAAVARYREAMLRVEPDLPPDLVAGDSLEAVDASLEAARRTVATIRARLASEAAEVTSARGFPAGSPARADVEVGGLTSAEKIAWGLQIRERE